ncbi:hypothetical protein EV368DRAFT_83861 [Lentinula lateritia]|nr:hypothetical protein EV368DRAFT_83861 [Lentinula lateritia]
MSDLTQQDALRNFPDIGELNLAAGFLHACVTAESHERLTSELCTRILLTDSTLREKLNEAHRSRNLEVLDRLCAYLQRNVWRYQPHLKEVNEFLTGTFFNGKITLVANGEWRRPFWTPPKSLSNDRHTDPETTAHIENLHIPLGNPNKEIPLIVLHELGGFQHNVKLRNRLDRIFSRSSNTFLVNTSGTGKTKLLFEGLCMHWGFYMTCAIDSFNLGAADFPLAVSKLDRNSTWTAYLPSTSSANHVSLLRTNIRLVYRAVSEVLLARLLIFRMYLENTIASSDAFGVLKYKITRASLSDDDLDKAISHSWDEIQSFWDSPEMSTVGDFLYIALDEANVASRKYDEAFEDHHGRYPILKELIRGLRRQLGHLPIRFVVAGTIIPENHFQSLAGEWDDFRWCSDTGSFNDPEDHRRYVSQFMPVSFASSVTGQALIDRMWYWLRGRHRYTASFLAVLLHSNFTSPHTLLGNYIRNFTEYAPHDNEEYSRGEEARYNNWYSPLGSKGLLERSLSTAEMHRAVIAFVTTARGIIDCSTKDRILITEDYGYFMDPECSQIALDEPLTVTYGAGWLKKNSYFSIRKFISFFCNHKRDDIKEVTPSHYALYLALTFVSILDHLCDTSDVFTVIGLPPTSLPQVKLVTFTRTTRRLKAVDVHPWVEETYDRLVLMANSQEETLSWFKHERDEPFCVLHHTSSIGLILVFCLQLADARCFWVFVRISSIYTNKEDPNIIQDIKDLHPNEVFCDQPEILSLLSVLPNLCLDVGPFGVLRVSGSCWPEKVMKNRIPQELYPAGLLNIEGLDEADKRVSHDMLMRRLSRVIAQRIKNDPQVVSPGVVDEDDAHQKGKRQRGRSSTVVDDTGVATVSGTRKTKSVKLDKGDDVAGPSTSGNRRTMGLKSTNVDSVTSGSGARTRKHSRSIGKSIRSRRGQSRIGDIATGRASTGLTRPDDSNSSSLPSNFPYNLRKR